MIFLTVPLLKVVSVWLHRKSQRKSSMCQNFLRVWHLVILGRNSQKTPCMFFHVFSLHLHFYLYLYHKSFHANWWTGWLARARQIGIVGGILVNNSSGHAQDDAYLSIIYSHCILVPIKIYWITCSHLEASKKCEHQIILKKKKCPDNAMWN